MGDEYRSIKVVATAHALERARERGLTTSLPLFVGDAYAAGRVSRKRPNWSTRYTLKLKKRPAHQRRQVMFAWDEERRFVVMMRRDVNNVYAIVTVVAVDQKETNDDANA